ncbi:MAG: hypothetical protein JXR81_08865 [Candidatus Goldbacteria bacterium]|nr:hypothetical protein [Candidatus Goldiibacteriota bacterium]
MGLNSLFGSNGTVFAYGKNKGGIATDAGIEGKIDSPEIETGDQKIRVNRGKSSRDFAFVEYENKRVLRAKEQIDKQLMEAKGMAMKSDGAKKLKRNYVRHLEKNRENMIKNMAQKRIEKINMKTGTVEEQEMFNEEGKKIGWMKVKNREKIKVRQHKKIGKAAAADGDGKELEFTTESEGENITPIGKSKYKIKTTGIKVNEGVEFEWIKKRGAGK